MRFLAAALVVLSLAGCASPKNNYTPETQAFSEPALGVEVTAGVGEKMVSQGVVVRRDALDVLSPIQVSIGHGIGPGIYIKTGDDETADYFSPKLGDGGGKLSRSSSIFDLPSSLMLRRDGSLCVVTISNQFVCGAVGGQFERRKVDFITERSFQQTLIYSGRSGSKVNVGYREFTADVARMAFNNDVEYDMNESKVIGYKGAEIEILEATNRFIKYKVIRNFNAAPR